MIRCVTPHFDMLRSSLIVRLRPFVTIVENAQPLDQSALKLKSAGLLWEFMYTRSLFQTADMDAQGAILNEVAALMDAGAVKSTSTETMGAITAANLMKAHALLETGKAKGKIVLEGF